MRTVSATTALKSVQSEAEKIRNDETAEVGTVSIGDVIRQGDLYLISIGSLPSKRTPHEGRQLAPGTTQGSRHVLLGECQIFDGDSEETLSLVRESLKPMTVDLFAELLGPVFDSKCPVEVDHPEHGNRVLPAGVYAVVYQRAFGEEVRRQKD